MKSALSWEYNALINELTQGMEKANQLRLHLYSSEAPNLLLQNVLASYENALFILKRSRLVVQAKPVAATLSSDPSISVHASPKILEPKNKTSYQKDYRNSPKKRKMKHNTWTDQVRVVSENGLEGPKEDGYSWRKYGQKDILGAKYPRSYYRCTYRLLQDCNAIKQVQRSDDDPSMFDITYKGTHTCNQANYMIPGQASPAKQEPKHYSHYHQSQEQNESPLNLKTNLTGDLDTKDNYCYPTTGLVVHDSHQGAFSSLYSPGTSESEYLSAEMYQMMMMIHDEEAPNLQHSEIISAQASTTNSPIGGVEFPFDRVDFLDPNFPFNDLGFYT